MENSQKLKNIHDLEFNKKLNHQNILLVFLSSIGITVWFKETNLDLFFSILIKIGITLFLISFLIIVLIHYNKELNRIKTEIKNLN